MQQLESSRVKLNQLERELERVRQQVNIMPLLYALNIQRYGVSHSMSHELQGMYVGGSSGDHSHPGMWKFIFYKNLRLFPQEPTIIVLLLSDISL